MANDTVCPCGRPTQKTTKVGGPKKYCSDSCRIQNIEHGTYTAWRELKCRCQECLKWRAGENLKRKEAQRTLKERNRVFVSGRCENSQCESWFLTAGQYPRRFCSTKCSHQDKHLRKYNLIRVGQRSAADVLERDEQNRKRCFRCDDWLPIEAFNPSTHTSDLLSSRCRRCHVDAQHGLMPDRRREFLDQQNGHCAICDFVFTLHGAADRRTTYQVDHDHSCCPGSYSCGDCIRGLVCAKCNTGLGNFRENEQFLANAIRYVQRNKQTVWTLKLA